MFQSLFGRRPQAPGLAQNRVAQTAIKNITPAELRQRLQTGESLLVLDVRFPEEYAADGHIAGSRLLPLPNLRQRISELPTDRPIVCVCRSGNRSMVACEQLAGLGFTNLYNLSAGMVGWRQAGLPTG